jgi:hypothetical protein
MYIFYTNIERVGNDRINVHSGANIAKTIPLRVAMAFRGDDSDHFGAVRNSAFPAGPLIGGSAGKITCMLYK